MGTIRTRYMSGEDERQYMIEEDYEIYEKRGAPTGAVRLHYHDFYEVIYVMEGEFSSLVDNRTYNLKRGDFLLIGRNVMHNYHYVEGKHENSRRIVLWISEGMLEGLSEGEQDLCGCFSGRRDCAYHFPVYYEEILKNLLVKTAMTEIPDLEGAEGKRLFDKAQLILFFVYLNELCSRDSFYFTKEESIHHELVQRVNEYIEEHMSETILVEDLAGCVHMSKYYFLRRFKELTGMTVHSYLNNKRLMYSCEGLKEGMTIGEVWGKCGFSDYSSFLRNFRKEYGMSPTIYRAYLEKK